LHSSFFEILELLLVLDLEELEIKFWLIFKKFTKGKDCALLTSSSLGDKFLKHSPNSSPLEINSYWNRCGSKMWFKEALIVQF
jgi:hypothetical protein